MSGVYDDGFRTATQLSATTRAAADAVAAADVLTDYLPNNESVTLDYELDGDTLGLAKAASFRAYGATAPYQGEKSTGSRKGSLPASSVKRRLNELAQLRLNQAGDDAIGNDMERKATLNGQSIAVRAVLARGEAIAEGKVLLDDDGLNGVEIDFGRDAALDTAAAILWSDPDALLVSELLALQKTYKEKNGTRAAGALFSGEILAAMQVNKEVIGMAFGRGSDLPGRITEEAAMSVLRSNGIVDTEVYDGIVEDQGGAARRVIPEEDFILLPSRSSALTVGDGGPLGDTLWGVPAEALQPKYGLSGAERAGIFGAAFSQNDPEGMDVLASAIFLPALRRPNRTMRVKVLAS